MIQRNHNTDKREGALPLWRKLLADRGILEAAEQAGWTPNGNGWLYPLYDVEGRRCQMPNGAPIQRWKNYGSDLSPKYLWKPGNLGDHRPMYYLLPGVKDAIAKANGTVYIASGEPDVLAYQAAGFPNVLSWFGEANVPETLAEDLAALGVCTVLYYPDLDVTGLHSAQKVAGLLEGSVITFRAFTLPEELGEGGDINRLWRHCGFERLIFQARLASLSELVITPEKPEMLPKQVAQYRDTFSSSRMSAYARRALDDEIALLSGTSEGRNIQLNKSAFALGQLVGAGVLQAHEVETALTDAACAIGLSERETRATVKSGMESGIQQPRNMPANTPERQPNAVTDASRATARGAAPAKFELLSLQKLEEMPPTDWLLRDILPAQSLITLFGQSGSGKSFVALDFALRIAQNRPVVYVAAEGLRGYVNRVKSWCKFYQQREGGIYFVAAAPKLLDAMEVRDVINAVKSVSPVLIVLDTLARCMVGGDENSAKDMGLVIEACEKIQRATGAAVLLVHHTGKSGASERGSSALRGACDVMIELTNDDGQIALICSKMKDAPEFAASYFQLLPVEIEEERRSCVVVPGAQITQTRRDPLSHNQRRVLEALRLEVFAESGAKTAALVQTSGVSGGSIYRVLSVLKRLGYVQQARPGDPYFITPVGRDASFE